LKIISEALKGEAEQEAIAGWSAGGEDAGYFAPMHDLSNKIVVNLNIILTIIENLDSFCGSMLWGRLVTP